MITGLLLRNPLRSRTDTRPHYFLTAHQQSSNHSGTERVSRNSRTRHRCISPATAEFISHALHNTNVIYKLIDLKLNSETIFCQMYLFTYNCQIRSFYLCYLYTGCFFLAQCTNIFSKNPQFSTKFHILTRF